MSLKQVKLLRMLIAMIVAIIIGMGINLGNFILALAGLLIGMLFAYAVRKKTKVVLVDERIELISGQAGRANYTIVTITMVCLALIFIASGRRTGVIYYEALGTIFSYVALFSVAVYSLTYRYLAKKYGEDEK